MNDGTEARSDQQPHDDVGQPMTGPSPWRTGQPPASHQSPEVTHDGFDASLTTEHQINMEEYGECYDPNYKGGQRSNPTGDSHA